jgi:hypothetical protein
MAVLSGALCIITVDTGRKKIPSTAMNSISTGMTFFVCDTGVFLLFYGSLAIVIYWWSFTLLRAS